MKTVYKEKQLIPGKKNSILQLLHLITLPVAVELEPKLPKPDDVEVVPNPPNPAWLVVAVLVLPNGNDAKIKKNI